MSIFTETEPKDPEWLPLENERALREKLGDELYIWLELMVDETKKMG